MTLIIGPRECPKCKHPRVQVQVVAWWQLDHGAAECQGDDYLEIAPFPYAICDECGHQWRVEP